MVVFAVDVAVVDIANVDFCFLRNRSSLRILVRSFKDIVHSVDGRSGVA